MPRIPRIVHYIFGMTPDFGGKPWCMVHHVCLMSAVERIRPEQILFHCAHEPSGPWWDLSRSHVTLERIEAPQEIYGNPLLHFAHRASVVRLQVLLKRGGIYLDADVLVQRDFNDLLDQHVVMGWEGENSETHLADAIILAEPNSPYIARWLDRYRSFRSTGRDKYWAEHAVWVPAELARSYPDEITVLPYTAFFWPLWTTQHVAWIYDSTMPINAGAYANHLWETEAWEYFEDLTPGHVRAKDTNFHRWLAPFVAGLPDHYGAPSRGMQLAALHC